MYLNQATILGISLTERHSIRSLRKLCTKVAKWTPPVGHKTNILIHNSITKEKVPLVTKSSKYLTWYICGPTVYDSTHIGHAWCTYLRFDIIRRILERYTNLTVIQAMNITDVDDKIIQRSKEMNTNFKVISRNYEKEFFDDLASLGIKKPTIVARVTDFIPQIILFIETLLRKNIAYVGSDGSVYFSIERYGKHGKFQQIHNSERTKAQSLPMMKVDISDFALWKRKIDEPLWQSPWSLGRPGWHIECSVIASEYFGGNIDLHSGGIDLKFPHHENEESQSCAFHNTDQWVNYYLHSGHLQYKNLKMSKSLKNIIGVKEYLSNNSANYLRMLCLYTNYRSHIDVDGDEITKSIEMCSRCFQFFDDCRAYFQNSSNYGNIDSNRLLTLLETTKLKVDQHLVDDFDTKSAIFLLHELMSTTNSMLLEKMGNRCVISVGLVYSYLNDMFEFFGLSLSEKSILMTKEKNNIDTAEDIITSSITFRSNVRNVALSLKDPQAHEIKNNLLTFCDELRKQYQYNGISVKDRNNNYSTWSYVVTPSTKREKIKKKIAEVKTGNSSNAK